MSAALSMTNIWLHGSMATVMASGMMHWRSRLSSVCGVCGRKPKLLRQLGRRKQTRPLGQPDTLLPLPQLPFSHGARHCHRRYVQRYAVRGSGSILRHRRSRHGSAVRYQRMTLRQCVRNCSVSCVLLPCTHVCLLGVRALCLRRVLATGASWWSGSRRRCTSRGATLQS